MRRSLKAGSGRPRRPTKGNADISRCWPCGGAETGLILSDEFRDGNVPAMMSPLSGAKAAFSALPKTVETFYYRGDSASHEHELMDWLRNPEREGGPKGRIGFAISARMSAELQKAIDSVGEDPPMDCHQRGKRRDTLLRGSGIRAWRAQ